MALEDAWVLVAELARAPAEVALPAFQKARLPRVKRANETANANAGSYHLRNPMVRGLAFGGLRALSGVAPNYLLSRFDWRYGHDVTRMHP